MAIRPLARFHAGGGATSRESGGYRNSFARNQNLEIRECIANHIRETAQRPFRIGCRKTGYRLGGTQQIVFAVTQLCVDQIHRHLSDDDVRRKHNQSQDENYRNHGDEQIRRNQPVAQPPDGIPHVTASEADQRKQAKDKRPKASDSLQQRPGG